jgi:hypothetical protein
MLRGTDEGDGDGTAFGMFDGVTESVKQDPRGRGIGSESVHRHNRGDLLGAPVAPLTLGTFAGSTQAVRSTLAVNMNINEYQIDLALSFRSIHTQRLPVQITQINDLFRCRVSL